MQACHTVTPKQASTLDTPGDVPATLRMRDYVAENMLNQMRIQQENAGALVAPSNVLRKRLDEVCRKLDR